MTDKKIHYLYKITNMVNGKLYIGVTSNLQHRKLCHLKYHSHDRLVNRAVKKYGQENFTFEVICIGNKDYIYDLEIEAISLYNSSASGHGYNISSGGEGGKGGKRGPIESRSDDKFTYVSGFWFPNKRTAIRSLNWGFGMYQFRKQRGLLGAIQQPLKTRVDQPPVYVFGFWFPSRKVCLAVTGFTLYKYEQERERSRQSLIAL